MRQDRMRNVLLAAIATLLFLQLGGRLIPSAQAFGKKQYRSIEILQPRDVQIALDRASAEGWEYVGSVDHILIFKRFSF